MGLEDGYLIPYSSSDSIAAVHYLTQLVEILEDVNPDSSVKTSRLQQPQVLLLVAALGQLVF